MLINLADPTLFGNDAAEEEAPEVLASYFVNLPEFGQFLDISYRLQFARSRKGMGKSALLSKLAFDLSEFADPPFIISVTGSDLTALGEFSSPDPAFLLNQWQQVICGRINQEIGRHLSLAFSDSSMLMVEAAELAGLRNRSVLSSLLDRLESRLLPFATRRPEVKSQVALLRTYREGSATRQVWILIDDIDAHFIATDQYRLKLSTFVSACRKLMRELPGLFIRASIRTDVWTALRHHEDLDKAEQYMTDLAWTQSQMKHILAKRLAAYLERKNIPIDEEFNLNIEADRDRAIALAFSPKMSWADHSVEPILPLTILSGKRPRWMAQLCRLAGRQAKRNGRTQIRIHDLRHVMREFGRLRLSDLHKEHGHQMSRLEALIECFAGGPTKYTSEALLARLETKFIRHNPGAILDGAPVTSSLELAHFLFRTGFIQGINSDPKAPWRFVGHEERPELLRDAGNLDDGLQWGVYPSYRNVLSIK